MEIILKRNRILFIFFSTFFLVACSEDIVFTEYKTLQNAEWKAGEEFFFNFNVKDTLSPKNLFINIRNNKEYSYSNLFVITSLSFPSGNKIVDTLHYKMANEKGEFLGKGFSNIKESKLFYKENKVFFEKGEYKFTIYHAMRRQGEVDPIPVLEGIQDVGFSIETINND